MQASQKKRILFVDDEELLLKGLQRMLRSMRHEWEMRFVENGQAALDLIRKETFDAVITDMQMPGMNGVQLLETVMQDYPDIVRIILSGQLDQEMILKTVRSAHQHLSKPCDADLLKAILAQAFALRDLLADDNIQKLGSRIESLPSLPSLYLEIMEELQSANTSFKKIGEIIVKDVGMTAKILQMVNSAFFGLRRQISNPQDAVSYLGFETIKSLVLSAKIFSQFNQKKLPGFSLDNLWNHSMLTGTFSKIVAEMEGQSKEIIDDAYMVGLLHDLGKLILAQNFSESYQKVRDQAFTQERPLWQVEYEMLGATHAEIAAYLIGLWGIKYSVVEAIAFHHTPGRCEARMGILPIVHTADALAHETENPETSIAVRLDDYYLKDTDIMERFPAWQSACRAHIQQGENLEGQNSFR
jgi:HD-like signal output (HDOD) protein